ncbi:integrin alpha-4-like [Neocloeon triangulifer]|uniref:integrin alpha-4-like n=1 Tax=Neocloeon triangulifer TaxID=2078957 RepID=UPI00286F6401|nr:integrin alpha-4-like [Neocloeon triangulifer]
MAMILISLVCLALVQADAHNVDTDHPLVLKSPDQNENYFGFSVALVRANSNATKKYPPWLLVGAPKVDGHNYKCGLVKNEACRKISVTPKYKSLNDGKTIYHRKDSLSGSAVDANLDEYITCSPHLRASEGGVLRMHGVCTWGAISDFNFSKIVEPLANKNRALTERKVRVQGQGAIKNYIYGQAGFSVKILNSTKAEVHFVIGAPNVCEGKGSVARYSLTKAGGAAGNLIVLNVTDVVDFYSGERLNIGYSVTFGRYFSKSKTLYASGGPGYNTKGSVLIFDFPGTDGILRKTQLLEGQAVGENFGAALASGDINGDGTDELIVAAPIFSRAGEGFSGIDEGKVVIYSKDSARSLGQKHVIVGNATGGRFGTAVAFLGDLNRDKFGDFAIAAPYEDGGVVYLYYGNLRGFTGPLKIEGLQFEPRISGFGYSISRGVDVDNNGYLDFAVGAYKSGHTVLIRTKPVIQVKQTIEQEENLLTFNSTNFTILSCARYIGHRIEKSRVLIRTLELGFATRRIYFDKPEFSGRSTFQESEIFKKNQTRCHKLTFFIYENMTDFESPIRFRIEYSLPQKAQVDGSKETALAKIPAILKMPSIRVAEINFAPICSENEDCIADLHIELRFYNEEGKELKYFPIGLESDLVVQITLINYGMPARGAKITIDYPSYLHLLNDNGCLDLDFEEEDAERSLECSVVTPLLANRTQILNLKIESNELISTKDLSFSAKVKCKNGLKNSSTTVTQKEIRVLTEAAVTISGKPTDEAVQFDLSKEPHFDLRFHVEKDGLSRIEEVEVNITIPYALARGKKFLDWTIQPSSGACENLISKELEEESSNTTSVDEVDDEHEEDDEHPRKKRELHQVDQNYPANRTFSVNCSSHLWKCVKLTCRVGPFEDNDNLVEIKLDMTADFHVLRKYLGAKDIVQLKSEALVGITKPANVISPSKRRPQSAQPMVTLIRTVKKFDFLYDPTVIMISSVTGILLLLMMVLGLSKVGFFTRKDKEALEKMMKMKRPPIASLKDLKIMYNRCEE